MSKTTTLAGRGISSGRPFFLEIAEVNETVWLRAVHQSGRATVFASFTRASFNQWLQESDLNASPASILGRRSRGGKTVHIMRSRSGSDPVLTFVDQSGKTTNTTEIPLRDWNRFSKSFSSRLDALKTRKSA
ncbi:MAG: hypothetical protein KF760_27080 [Candidatus Eremiobacteraeota bacterium]|nr:hypothetical protein [Candidatus Eremiobacteraeota bacterium]MCW5872863.1 hypothetical protein [Candidatus Eremiobacteraeota bacterium]